MAIHCDKCDRELERNHMGDLQQATIRIGDGVDGVVRTGDWCRSCVQRIKQAIASAIERDPKAAEIELRKA